MSSRMGARKASQSATTVKTVKTVNAVPKAVRKSPTAQKTARVNVAPAPRAKPEPKPEDSDDTLPLLLTVERAAQKLGICRDFMYRLLAGPQPAVRSVKIGRSRRVPVSELEAYIARRLSEVA